VAAPATTKPAAPEAADTASTGIGISAREIRQRFPALFQPSRAIFWTDLLASTAVGWAGFALALAWSGPASLLAQIVAVLGLYRAVLFIHELAHLRPGAIPHFERVFDALVGIPLLVPSLMYVGSHGDHHRRNTYGTDADPEYEPMAHWSRARILASTGIMLTVPLLLVLRWGVVAPLSWLLPPLRRLTVAKLSTLVVNVRYRRPAPTAEALPRWRLGERGAAALVWSVAAGVSMGLVPVEVLWRWYAVTAAILVINHFRTLTAHRYENRGERMDTRGQLADSINLRGIPGLTVLLAPVGLRYHGLHHLVPAVPYHHLGSLHRELIDALPVDSPYRLTVRHSLTGTLRALLERAARNTAAG